MSDWSPELYMQFRSERTQPSIDLVTRIDQAEPTSILDIGCGPGNSTQVLVNRWPKASITGLDSSEAMIDKARIDYPDQQWIMADGTAFWIDSTFDIVFSNAAIQWMPDHKQLLVRFHDLLAERGTLAIQIPMFWDMPLGKIIAAVAGDERWRDQTEAATDLFTIHDYNFYYDVLSNLFQSIDIWETDYMHILDNHETVMEMIRSTGMKPYLERLDSPSQRTEFEAAVLESVIPSYPSQKNGKVLLPFKRLFFIAYK